MDTEGPIILWQNYGYEGWQPKSYQTIKDALAVNDEDGLTEFADVMCAARAALSK